MHPGLRKQPTETTPGREGRARMRDTCLIFARQELRPARATKDGQHGDRRRPGRRAEDALCLLMTKGSDKMPLTPTRSGLNCMQICIGTLCGRESRKAKRWCEDWMPRRHRR